MVASPVSTRVSSSGNAVHRLTRPGRRRRGGRATDLSCKALPILVNSTAGKMGFATAESVVMAGLDLVPVSFAAVESKQQVAVKDVPVDVWPISSRDEVIADVKAQFPGLLVIDFTLPDAVNSNAEFYVKHELPFVMGTTGGDRDKLLKDVRDAGLYAVIAANMGKQIVALQAMLQYAAREFPGAFAGYKLDVVESHQSTKVDTSGTAKDIVLSFNKLGMPCEEEDIRKVRDAESQMNEMKVPEVSPRRESARAITETKRRSRSPNESRHPNPTSSLSSFRF